MKTDGSKRRAAARLVKSDLTLLLGKDVIKDLCTYDLRLEYQLGKLNMAQLKMLRVLGSLCWAAGVRDEQRYAKAKEK